MKTFSEYITLQESMFDVQKSGPNGLNTRQTLSNTYFGKDYGYPDIYVVHNDQGFWVCNGQNKPLLRQGQSSPKPFDDLQSALRASPNMRLYW